MTIILNCGVLLQKTLEFSDNTIKRPEQWRKSVRSVNNDWIRRHFLRSAKKQIDGDKPQTLSGYLTEPLMTTEAARDRLRRGRQNQ